jgi:hypothetical protein
MTDFFDPIPYNVPTSWSSTYPQWFRLGHLRDDIAQQHEDAGRQARTTTTNTTNLKSDYMRTMLQPQLGMRTETTILTTSQNVSFMVSGYVTWVGEEPSLNTLRTSNSLFWNMTTGHRQTAHWTPTAKRQVILDCLGCLHGQRMKSTSRLSSCASGRSSVPLPIRTDDVMEITYQFDDTKYFPWVVQECRMLGRNEIEHALPPYFYQYFEGCTCPRCLSKSATSTNKQEEYALFESTFLGQGIGLG